VHDDVRTKRDRPKERPDIAVKVFGKFGHKVTAVNPNKTSSKRVGDADGVRYFWQKGGTPPAKPGDLPHSLYNRNTDHVFEWDPSDEGQTVYFAVCYSNDKGQDGDFSAIAHSVISG
jgi:hypothetical protein